MRYLIFTLVIFCYASLLFFGFFITSVIFKVPKVNTLEYFSIVWGITFILAIIVFAKRSKDKPFKIS